MFLNFLTIGIENIGQSRLLKPLCPNMLGSDGAAKPDLLKGIDALLCEEAVRAIDNWNMPGDLPIGALSEDRWRTVSSLQKAIRRGDVRGAMAAAHAAYGMEPRYLFRRLAVCAVEDVMLGNLYAVALTLALVGNKRSRDLPGEQKVAVWLAAQLAGGWKDRSACNLCVVVDYDRRIHPRMDAWAQLPDGDLAAKASDLGRPVEDRMLAAWLLAGTKRFWNLNVPTSNDRPRWSLMRLMASSGMPLILYYVADRAAMRGGDCMFVSLLPLWQILNADGDELGLRRNILQPDPGLGPLLAAAYDMHTRDGRVALKWFADVPEISAILSRILVPKDRLPALFAAVFAVEGGKLDRQVSSPQICNIHSRAIRIELEYFGLQDSRDQYDLLQQVEQRLLCLYHLRLEAVAAVRPCETIESVEMSALAKGQPT